MRYLKSFLFISLLVFLTFIGCASVGSEIKNTNIIDIADISDLGQFLEQKGYAAIPLSKLFTGHLYLNAEVNGIPARLILDTGAGGTVFDENSVEKFHFELVDSEITAAGAGGVGMSLKTSIIDEFKINDFVVSDFQIYLMNLDHVNEAFGLLGIEPRDGVIGADILAQGRAIIDYGNMILYLLK